MNWKKYPDEMPPEDDRGFLVVNINVTMIPIKAYWDTERRAFISLETSGTAHALSITHGMDMPGCPD